MDTLDLLSVEQEPRIPFIGLAEHRTFATLSTIVNIAKLTVNLNNKNL